ncbi:MAG: MFS transporter [Sphingomonadales bacterium]|nr:MFS transporter [Sphingomonadales bacterium]
MSDIATPPTAASEARYPRPAYAWFMVALLTVAYILNFVDRYILGLLAGAIKEDLGLTDTQLGLLGGLAFGLLYAIAGLFMGWLADHVRRTWIVGIGIALWSAATAASGLAKNFGQLFVARMGVGIGESTLSPCAMSMIADSFPEEKRGKPIALYSAALGIGAGLASLLSAAVLQWAASIDQIIFPVIGEVAAWQFVFLVLGIPGVFFSLVFFVLREPPRQRKTGAGHPWEMLAHVARRWTIYASFVSVFCFMTIMAYSQFFLPLTFERTWGWSPATYAFVNGLTILAVSPLAVNLSGYWSDRLYARGRRDAPLLIAILGVFVIVPTGVIAPLMPSGIAAFVIYGFNTIGIGMVTATGVTALLGITPGRIRAQTIALYYMAISLTGLLIGPPAVGWLNDNVFTPETIRYSMALLPFVFGLPVMLLAPITRRLYLAEFDAQAGAR